jgi:hypothetical protein
MKKQQGSRRVLSNLKMDRTKEIASSHYKNIFYKRQAISLLGLLNKEKNFDGS